MSKERELQLPSSEDELPPCGILIDREGDWYHGGSLMERKDIVAHLCQHICRDESRGHYLIQMAQQRCYLEVEDTPLVVTSVLHEKEKHGQERLLLSIKYIEAAEPLDPASLWVGEENVLYCNVKEDKIPARFLRPAYYQVAEFIQEDQETGRFYLFLGNERYYIETPPTRGLDITL